MSPPYDNRGSSRSRRGVWSHWVPLAVTLTVATAGLAAWVWSQRKESSEDHVEAEPDLDYENADYGENPAYGASAGRKLAPPSEQGRQRDQNYAVGAGEVAAEGTPSGWGSRVTSAFTSNPGKTVAAGVAAAGAAVGKALASIREEDRPEHESNPWPEEREVRREKGPAPTQSTQKKRKTVAIVISADSQFTDDDDDIAHEHASILNHIPRHNDLSAIKLFVLIYAPSLKDSTVDTSTSNRPPPSVSSSFSNVGYDQAQTPEAKSPVLGASAENTLFNAVYSHALALVDKETMILPFTTPNGHTHILRHLQPDIIYLQESLAGDNGSYITNIQTWLRHDIVLVVGAEDGAGGLADSESEAEKADKPEKWWQRPERVGRGRGIIVVDSVRVNDDWSRRVQGRE
ncbi:peroxin 22 [Trichoderma arundinaceum]|uniref:Peroxin 22 n=1 Tax=Trichoderma arundinaceum TaxID=490622 RepID=A0A395P146_TRIAR|nr:peroxin 22 [Trichoderma arundinaceum]